MQKMLFAGFSPLSKSLLLALLGFAASSGCAAAAACDTSKDENPDKYTQGTIEGGVYRTSAWTGPLLSFPGGKQYVIVHNLGCIPSAVVVDVSFDEGGTSDGKSMAPSAGNMSEISDVTSEHLRIRNSTCSDLFVRVVAFCGAQSSSDAGLD